ncbi:hypothetical protein T439DRAFT_321340 [Meredithblackwellia eburnea MCA 4105]
MATNPVACSSCRRRKVRCVATDPSTEICAQCTRHKTECTFKAHQRGRPLGSQNRVKRTKTNPESPDGVPVPLDHPSSSSSSAFDSTPRHSLPKHASYHSSSGPDTELLDELEDPQPLPIASTSSSAMPHPAIAAHLTPGTNLEDILSPLAVVTCLTGPSLDQQRTAGTATQIHNSNPKGLFKVKLDNLPALDPIRAGVCSHSQAEYLLRVFFDGPAGFCGFLDRTLHTIAFLQARSGLLLSILLYLGARHDVHPATTLISAELTLRIKAHLRETIYPKVLLENYRSVQIVQSFIIWGAFLPEDEGESRTDGLHLFAHALRVAVEIGLHREFREIDGDLKARMLIRDAERTWITCFLADRSWAAQTGRPPLVPEDDLTLGSVAWLDNSIALPEDASLVALVQLRRLQSRKMSSEIEVLGRQRDLDQWKLDWIRPKFANSCRIGHLGLVYFNYTKLLLTGQRLSQSALHDLASQSLQLVDAAVQLPESVFLNAQNTYATMISYGCHLVFRLRALLPSQADVFQKVATLQDRLLQGGSTPPHKAGVARSHAEGLVPVLELWATELEANKQQPQPPTDVLDTDAFWLTLLGDQPLPAPDPMLSMFHPPTEQGEFQLPWL